MKSIRFALATLLMASSTAFAGTPFEPIQVAPGTILPGRCHMGECVFTKVVSSSAKVRPGQETIVEMVEQVALHPADNDKAPIEWGQQVAFRVTCSYARPQVSFDVEGEQVVHNLTLSPEGTVFGFQIQSVLSYFRACHNAVIEEGGIDAAIQRFGYDVIVEE